MKFLVVIFCLFFFFIVFLVKISEKVSLQTFHNPLQRVSILDSSYQCQFAFSSSWSNPTKMFLESFHVGKMVCFLMRDRKETLNDRSLNWPQIFVEAQSKQIFFFRFFFFKSQGWEADWALRVVIGCGEYHVTHLSRMPVAQLLDASVFTGFGVGAGGLCAQHTPRGRQGETRHAVSTREYNHGFKLWLTAICIFSVETFIVVQPP